MKKIDIKKLAGIGTLSVGLVFGMAGFAGATSGIKTTGPNSSNEITHDVRSEVTVDNTNDLTLSNSNGQSASSGNVQVTGNTTGGDAWTGSAMNENEVMADISVDSSSSSAESMNMPVAPAPNATIENTGPSSTNTVDYTYRSNVEVTNDNTIDIQNTNNQTASSGPAVVSGNTTGGDARSGNVSNSSSSSFTVHVAN